MRGWIAGTLLATLAAAAIGAVAIAQEDPPDPTPEPAAETTANVEVRVWQDVNNARSIYISARPEDGSWATLGTIPLPLDDGHSSNGRFRYGDIAVAVPVGSGESDVEVRVWQDVRDALSVYISARPDGGSWATLGTIPLPLDDGHSSSGRFRYGDITVEVPVPLPPAPTPMPTPTPTPTPWVDPRPADTYTLAELAAMPAPRAPQAPPPPDHVLVIKIESGESDADLYLIADPSRVRVELSQPHGSEVYPVLCNPPEDKFFWYFRYLRCNFGDRRPLDSSGTRYIQRWSAWGGDGGTYEFVSASLDGDALTCQEQEPDHGRYSIERSWWCYEPNTYRAWEAARDRVLATPDDPLQRYLRQQGDPPLWYDNPPFEDVGTSTTGAFPMGPYVAYRMGISWKGEEVIEDAAFRVWLVCVPANRSGIAMISRSQLSRTDMSFGGTVYTRQFSVCEIEVDTNYGYEGTVAITFSPDGGQ